MPTEKNELYLYEALELRAEYDARIKTLKECLPESRQSRDRFGYVRDEERVVRPSPEFNVGTAREQLKVVEYKRRKLNTAIQQANFAHRLAFKGEQLTLAEALELRKGLNEEIGGLHNRLVKAAFQRVIYKEGRDIVETPDISYSQCETQLDDTRRQFRFLNRVLRAAGFDVIVAYQDE